METDGGRTQSRTTGSGAVGGPATAGGVDYQVMLAVRYAIELLEEFTAEGGLQHCGSMVNMEFRASGSSSLVPWDFGVLGRNVPWQLTEAKGNLKKSDVAEFCERIGQHELRNKNVRFSLSYGTSSPSHLDELSALVRLAKEASDDEGRFRFLVEQECRHASDLLKLLGNDAFWGLRQVVLDQCSEPTLTSMIDRTADRICRTDDVDHLKSFLYQRFTKAMKARETITIRKLFDELTEKQIELRSPRIDDLGHIPLDVRHAVDALRHCSAGLPLDVVAGACGLTVTTVADKLRPFQDTGGLSLLDGLVEIHPCVRRLSQGGLDERAECVVEVLLPFIKQNSSATQLRNAVELFRQLPTPSGRLTLDVFEALDKPIKRLGDKKLVLDYANDCLAKARAAPRIEGDDKAARAEAKVLICGISWVAQRVGRLKEAWECGQRSLEIGKDIEWKRNTAFCLKCLGRLARVEGEVVRQAERRSELLSESVRQLALQRTFPKFSRVL